MLGGVLTLAVAFSEETFTSTLQFKNGIYVMQYTEITWGFHTPSPPMFLYLWVKFIVDLYAETL